MSVQVPAPTPAEAAPPADAPEQPPDAPQQRAHPWQWVRRHRAITAVLSVLVVLAIAALVAALVTVPYYAITPGNAQNVSGLITLPKSDVHDHPGGVLLTDVFLTPLRAITYPVFALDSQASIVQSQDILGFVPASEYNVQGSIDMDNATQAATYVALTEAGYKPVAVPEGAQVYQVDPAAPSYSSLAVGDVIIAVDGHKTPTIESLQPLLKDKKPGQVVSITIRPSTAPLSGAPQTVQVPLGEYRLQDDNARCYPVGGGTKYPLYKVSGGPYPYPCIGIELYSFYRLDNLPFPVVIDPQGIVGPSAGLAFTLGLMNELDPEGLTGGRTIAATGTMSLDGAVGDVGGVPQKTIAVENAGATVFFVPRQEYKAALSKANSHLTVVEVSSVTQAIDWLLQHGGKLAFPSSHGGAP